MLDRLLEYGRSHGLLSEPGFKAKEVRWAVECDAQGGFLGLVELGDPSLKNNPGRGFAFCPDLSQGELIAGGQTKSHFLVETAEVVGAWEKKALDPKAKAKMEAKHAYFVGLLERAGQEVMPELGLAARCLSEPESLAALRESLERQKVKPGDKVTFRVGGAFALESSAWQDWWRALRLGLGQDQGQPTKRGKTATPGAGMLDILTGLATEPAPTHPKISGLSDVGGLPTGDVLVGFDKASFGSFGLEQSANAAMSEATTSDYRTALNHLLRHQAKRLAGAKVAYWFKDKVAPEDDPLAFLEDPSAEVLEMQAHDRARKLLEALRQGQRPELADNRYYALTLSGQSGRVMVRDWMEGGFTELVENINAWFDDLAVVRREGGDLAAPPKFMAVMGSCVRDLKDLPGPFAAAMWKVAIRRLPIPLSALAQALARFKVRLINDESPTLAGVGLMKAFFVRKGGSPVSPYLNPEHPQPAYHCGRLLAMLAALQRSALGDVGAGVVQRYYAAASATPALVLGRLARTAQFHLNKLEPGLAHWYESQMAQVWGSLRDSLPPTLSLEGQSLFALGYYQQLADLRTKKNPDQAPAPEEN